MQRSRDSKKIQKRAKESVYSSQQLQYQRTDLKKKENLVKQNGKKDNCRDTSSEKLNEMTYTWPRRWNLKWETESLFIAEQNDALRPYHV